MIFSHRSSPRPARTSAEIHNFSITNSGTFLSNSPKLSSVKYVKNLPFLTPSKSPYLNDEYTTPPYMLHNE